MSATNANPERHCGHERERKKTEKGPTFELKLGYIRLQKHVDFGGGFINTLLDRDRHTFQQFCEFELLLLSHLEIRIVSEPIRVLRYLQATT